MSGPTELGQVPADDEWARYEQSYRPPSSKRFFGVLLGVFALAGAVGGGLAFKKPILRALEGAPAPYDDAAHRRPLRKWMKKSLPAYVIAVSSGDPKARAEAADTLRKASAFHAGLAARTDAILHEVESYLAWTERKVLQDDAEAVARLEDIGDEVRRAERMLREMGAPYSVDPILSVHKRGTRWDLQFLVRTSEVLGVSRYRVVEREPSAVAAGSGAAAQATAPDGTGLDDTLTILRIKRLDGLNVVDLVHGKASGGYAVVLAEGPKKTVHHRYLPALADDGDLRDLFEAPTDEHRRRADTLRDALIALLPEDLQPDAAAIGAFAAARRAALEETHEALTRYRRKLVEPDGLFVKKRWVERMERTLGKNRHPETLERLRRHVLRTHVDKALVAKVERARDVLLDHFSRGVERHEAWHLLVPDPDDPEAPEAEDLPDQASKEAVAYLGELADAGPELPLMFDAFVRLYRSAAESRRNTATHLAVRTIGPALWPEFASLDDGGHPRPGRPGRAGALLPAELAKKRAAALLASWYGERRHLELIDYTPGAAALAPSSR